MKNRRRKAIALYRAGASLREVARIMGVSHTSVCAWLDADGVARRKGRNDSRLVDLVGRRFGKLLVVRRDGRRYPTRWIVRCDCGRMKSMARKSLIASRSCGCLRGRKRQSRAMIAAS